MRLSRRQRGSVTRSLLAVLACVWLSLPLHDCFAMQASVAPSASAVAPGEPPHCAHHAPRDAAGGESVEHDDRRCVDLVTASTDVRPGLAFDQLLPVPPVAAVVTARADLDGAHRAAPTARPPPRPDRPVHLLKSSLLI